MKPAPASSASVKANSAITEGGRDAEDHSGRQTYPRKVGEDAPVHRELNPVGPANVLRRGIEESNPDDRERQAKHAADHGEHEALHEELTYHAPAGRAD